MVVVVVLILVVVVVMVAVSVAAVVAVVAVVVVVIIVVAAVADSCSCDPLIWPCSTKRLRITATLEGRPALTTILEEQAGDHHYYFRGHALEY